VSTDLCVTRELYVSSDLCVTRELYVSSDPCVTKELYVSSDLCVTRKLYVSSNLCVTRELYVSSDLCVTRELPRYTHFYRGQKTYLNYTKQYSLFLCVFKENVFRRIIIADKLIFSGCVESLRHSL
jgi:hypothetical protein